jgi:hypothetical protein
LDNKQRKDKELSNEKKKIKGETKTKQEKHDQYAELFISYKDTKTLYFCVFSNSIKEPYHT